MRSTIGVVGGLGPEGTVHYYRKLAARLGAIPFDEERPGLIVDHVWIDRFASLLRRGAEADILALLGDSILRLQRAGADLALVAAVTPHKFLEPLRRSAPIPLVDLVEATEREVSRARYARVGLLGTRATLTEPFFKGGLERAGIAVTVPAPDDIAYLDELIFGALASGPPTDTMKRRIGEIVARMSAAAALDAIVVACTDLMDLMATALPLVDPVECHVQLAVARARSKTNG
jgi:aspartate racemase